MPTSINPDDFPHIIEAVVGHSDWSTLLTLRLLSSRMQRFVNPLLCKELLELSTDSAGDLTVSAWMPWLYDRPFCVPYFHPSGNEFLQRAAMNRARRIRIICERSTERLSELLKYINPDAEVTLLHSSGSVFGVDVRIPRCAELLIEAGIDPHCACQDESPGKLIHEAGSVTMHFIGGGGEEQRGLPRCVVIDGAVNLGVLDLTLADQFSTIRPVLCGDTDIDTNPNLYVRVGKSLGKRGERLRSEIAERFHIPQNHVSFL